MSNYPSASTLFTYSFPPLSLTVFNFAPAAPSLKALPSASGQFAFQLNGQSMTPYIIQTSTNLVTWTSVSTNLLSRRFHGFHQHHPARDCCPILARGLATVRKLTRSPPQILLGRPPAGLP